MSPSALCKWSAAAAAAAQPLDFVLPGLLAGTPGLIVGPGAAGKTFLALHIAVAVALGQPVCPGEGGSLWPAPQRGGVGVILGEDPPGVVARRQDALIRGLGLGDEKVEELDEACDIVADPGADLAMIAKTNRGSYVDLPFSVEFRNFCQGRRLVILDPLAAVAQGLDESSNGDMSALMRRIARIGQETGCAVLVLHHFGKPSGDVLDSADDWGKARGASALTTSVRLQLNLAPLRAGEAEKYGIGEPDRKFYVRLAQTKANYSAPGEPVILHRGDGGALERPRLVDVPQVEQPEQGRRQKGGRNGAV